MVRAKRQAGGVNGNTLFYAYVQRQLLKEDVWLYQMFTARLVTSLGVWFHPDYYTAMPIFLPHVVRDTSAQSRYSPAGRDERHTPNPKGYLRDDNTMVKNLVGSVAVTSPRAIFGRGRRLDKGWTASHVWRRRSTGESTSTHPVTNSFIPNLVWLPTEISKLSDHSPFVQQYLQAIAHHLYGHIELPPAMYGFVQPAWAELPVPSLPEEALPNRDTLNYFEFDDVWLERRREHVRQIHADLEAAARGETPQHSGYRSYRQGLATLHPDETEPLREYLDRYLSVMT